MSPEPVTYIPPMWIHNRAIVRERGTVGQGFVLYRLRLAASREESRVSLLPVHLCAEVLENLAMAQNRAAERDQATITLPLSEVEDRFEETGRIMSVIRAPL
jgi:hypothetical protein